MRFGKVINANLYNRQSKYKKVDVLPTTIRIGRINTDLFIVRFVFLRSTLRLFYNRKPTFK